jgi:hypothetical protein
MMAWWLPIAITIGLTHLNTVAEARDWNLPSSTPSLKKTILALVFVFFAVMLTPAMNWIQNGTPTPMRQVVHVGTPLDIVTVFDSNSADIPDRVKAFKGLYNGGPMFCSESVGEYLYWKGYPVLMYTHAHLYSPEHYYACLAVKNARPGWWEFLDRTNANMIVIEPHSIDGKILPLVEELPKRSEWDVVLDERDRADIPDKRGRLFVAVRKAPQVKR